MLGAASDSIADPGLKSSIDYYTEECLSKVLPLYDPSADGGFLDRYFSRGNGADQKLASIPLGSGPYGNCLELKQGMNQSLADYAHRGSSVYDRAVAAGSGYQKFWQGFGQNYDNWVSSNLLVNHYLDNRESTFGIEKGAEVPGTGGRIMQYLNRAFSMDGVLSILGRRDLKGASVAAKRSLELSDHFARAPHVAGFLKMLLVGFFPILVFFLAAGKWKPVLWWWMTCMYIWNLSRFFVVPLLYIVIRKRQTLHFWYCLRLRSSRFTRRFRDSANWNACLSSAALAHRARVIPTF